MATASPILNETIQSHRRTSASPRNLAGWHRLLARWKAVMNSLVPLGYEDEFGFHYGEAPADAEFEC